MRLSGYLFLARRYNKQRFLESLLIILIIGIGIAVLMVSQSFINSEKKIIDEMLDRDVLHINHCSYVSIDDFFFGNEFNPLIARDDAKSETNGLSIHDYLILCEEFKEKAFVYIQRICTASSKIGTITMGAFSPNYFAAMGFELERGEFFTDEDFSNASQVVVLGADFAKVHFPDTDPIGKEIYILGTGDCQVLGVLKAVENERFLRLNDWGKEADRLVYVPYTSMYCPKHYSGVNDQLSVNLDVCFLESIEVEPFGGKNQPHFLKQELQEVLLANNMEHLIVRGPFLSTSKLKTPIFIAFLINVIASLALLIAGINIMNLMLSRVLKRTKNYGLAISLGSTKKSILFQVLVEMILLGFLGGSIGALFSYWASSYLTKVKLCPGLLFGFRESLLSLILGSFVSIIFVLYPALQISKTNPTDMLR